MSVNSPRRGELHWVNLDPIVGSEMAKTRPCLIISNDVGNQFSDRVIIAPLTSAGFNRVYPFEVVVPAGQGGISETSKVALDQIRTIDKQRLGRRIGALPSGLMQEVNRAIRLSLAVERE